MSVTQTVEIPDSHRLTIDVPREIPAGRTILIFKPAAEQSSVEQSSAGQGHEPVKVSSFNSAKKYKTAEEIDAAIARIQELCKDSSLSVDSFLEERRQEMEYEEERYRRRCIEGGSGN